MAAFYDTYDYPSYWIGREYEHKAEVIALTEFLKKIPKIDTILEMGAGFGRLTPSYLFRARKAIITDPSSKLLKIAKANFSSKKVKFIQSTLENLPQKLKRNSVDLIILVRVLHHIKQLDLAFASIDKILRKDGFLILEFANKSHLKATIKEFLKGNFTFPLDIFPKDVGKPKKQTISFKNYHPDTILEKLDSFGFSVIEIRSVSNIRSTILKKILPGELLLLLEEKLQIPLANIFFGPSIFILAKKKV